MARKGLLCFGFFAVSNQSAMESLPLYITAGFIATTLFTAFLIYRASHDSFILLCIIATWLFLQGSLTLAGFYRMSSGVPPRFALLLVPPVFLMAGLFLDRFDIKSLMLIHLIRIPVELTLFALFIHKAVPVLMTFEGGNLDILSGFSAPFIYYFGYIKPRISRKWLLVWNIACLLLLGNVVARAILSAPFDFQKLGFEQPNIALFYFPFSWLPAFVVPVVLLAHLITIRNLVSSKNSLHRQQKE